MKLPSHKNQSVDLHNFAMIPKADIPRSSFNRQSTYKTTFDAGYLIPFYADEVLPGDSFRVGCTMFARLATPLFPTMDNLHLDTFFFFVPIRLIWTNWVKMMGEQDNPGDSISYTTPTVTSPVAGYVVGTLYDYLGLPTVGQLGGGATYTHSAFWTRAYNLIWNQWFRDENLQNSVTVDKGDGPDTYSNYVLLRRGKRKDYFTSALPWPQKGATAVSLPLGTTAPIKTNATNLVTGAQNPIKFLLATGSTPSNNTGTFGNSDGSFGQTSTAGALNASAYPANLYADLSAATAATINQLRLAFQTQRVLERDARGGTRYTEIVRSHFGVTSPDARLQRAEYLGGGSSPVIINPTVQTSGTSASGTTTPMGTLAGVGAVVARNHGFTQSFTEHGVILGLMSVRADLTYQQGVRKMWNRSTRYDYYLPAFAMLGEQSILNREIYADGSANDTNVFGYMERWAEYRYRPSMITGLFKSTSAGTLDAWHLAQKFASLPTLNDTFIQDTPPLERALAVTSTGKELLLDAFINERLARAMPMYSVPGMIDHF
jgi:hypothetical protein